MNNETFNNIIDKAYKNYKETHQDEIFIMSDEMGLNKEDFVKKVNNNYGFGFLFGITLNDRELSWEERRDIAENVIDKKDFYEFGNISPFTDFFIHYWLNRYNIPTKLITLTHKGETIEVYE